MGHHRKGQIITLALAAALGISGAIGATPAAAAEADPVVTIAPGVPAVDPQHVANLDDLTWNDYHPTPYTDWADPSLQPTIKKWKAAVVLVDYPDEPFQITQPAGSNIWGNPGPSAHDIARADVPKFYTDLLNTPSDINNGHTINQYWMEDTAGRYGVQLVPFGPYKMPKKSYQYHYGSFANGGSDPTTKCPVVLSCNGNFRADALAAWKADTGAADPLADYDNVFYVGAGEDQSSSWLEFGQMKFATPQDVPDAYGPPQEWKDAVKAQTGQDAPNWSPTRYVPWTAWASGASMWPNASGNTSIESESSGAAVYAHEFSHNLKIGDNYGNPYATDPKRDQSGAWDMLSRGSFNGPGGPHQRYKVPAVTGAVMGAQHMLRDKIFLKTVDESAVLTVKRSELAVGGIALTKVTAREVQPAGSKSGVNVVMDGGDMSTCESQGASGDKAWMCDGGGFDNYTLEVVDQMGSDSFTADNGVLLAKTKDTRSPNKWVIDANPQDIDLVDYHLADGTAVKMTRGDHRQLNDALFKAGTGSGSEFEYLDAANKLQFYVLNSDRDADGVLSYDLAVRSTAGTGPQLRGTQVGRAAIDGVTPGQVASCTFPLKNTGKPGSDPRFTADVYRITGTASGRGWSVALPQQVVALHAGATTDVVAYAVRDRNRPLVTNASTLTVKARSESDPTKSATLTCAVRVQDTAK